MNSTTSTRIKQAMNSSNLKQIDIVNKAKSLEKETGIKLTKTDLSQYVNGKVTPGQKKLYILAKILNVSEAWLLGYDVDRARIDDKSRAKFNQQQDTMAAHLDYSDLTEDDQKEVEQFIQFIRNRKK
ncbi:helix-turn-helix domain-containing protein [Staphylococcus hominis]|uniref:helix-turn-helix domain-containing protein n=1 Tax=Staphylococcus hominis TaxID=1290 RepID=UPI0034CD8259